MGVGDGCTDDEWFAGIGRRQLPRKAADSGNVSSVDSDILSDNQTGVSPAHPNDPAVDPAGYRASAHHRESRLPALPTAFDCE